MLFAAVDGVEAFASRDAFSRVGAAIRRCSFAGLASFTGFGGAVRIGFGSDFLSIAFSSGGGSSVTLPKSVEDISVAAGGVPCGVAVALSGVGASTIVTAGVCSVGFSGVAAISEFGASGFASSVF